MWKRLPLSLKLILPLILMQVMAIGGGVLWLTSYLETSRLRELEHVLDSQADAIEDAIIIGDGKMQFDAKSELLREMFHDPNGYFVLLSPDGEVWDQSLGPSVDTRDFFHKDFSSRKDGGGDFFRLRANHEVWLVMHEVINDKAASPEAPGGRSSKGNPKIGGHLYASINAGPALRELRFIKRALILGAVAFVFLTSFGTALIVSHTTANLKSFSRSIAEINPHKPEWAFAEAPRSAEEGLLFSSFRAMITAIKSAAESQRLFVANASHELKTPVAGLLLTLEVMLSRRRDPEEYAATGRDLLKSVRGLKRLSGALLDLAKLENMTGVAAEAMEFTSLCERLAGHWLPVAKEKNVNLTFDVKPAGLRITANSELLEVAIGNFIDNAIKYTPEHGLVAVSAMLGDDGKKISVTVKDNGIGMREEDLARLGEVFFRANEARSDDMSYGLGFAQGQRIVKLMNGHLFVWSHLGQGMLIRLDFPV